MLAFLKSVNLLLKNFANEYKVVLLGLLVVVLSSGLLFQYCETQRLESELNLVTQQFNEEKKTIHAGYDKIISEIKRIELDYSKRIDKVKEQLVIDQALLEESIKKNVSELSKDFVKMSELLKMMGFEPI